MQKYNEICVSLDIETSGLDPEKDEIIEIAIVKFQGKRTLESWDTLINPQCEAPYYVLSMTGISQGELDSAEDLDNIKDKIKKFVGDYPIVGHNIDFDLNFLEAKGIKLDNPRYDTWHLSTILLPNFPAYGLEFLARRFNLTHKETHRALSDTEACRDLFLFLIDKIYQLDINLLSEMNSFLQRSDWDLKRIFKEIQKSKVKKDAKIEDFTNSIPLRQRLRGMPSVVLTKEGKFQRTKEKIKKEEKELVKKIPEMSLESKNLEEIFQNKKIINFLIDELNFCPEDIKTISKVADCLSRQNKILLESPSYCIVYLIPAVYYAIASNSPVIVSSAKNNRKIEEELAVLKKIIPFDFKGTFIDSPYHYLCYLRFSEFKKRKIFDLRQLRVLLKILVWFKQTKTGHRSQLALLREEYNIWQEVNADLDFCPNQNCPHKEKCFWQKIKKDAQKSDLILTNSRFLIFDFQSSLEIFKNYKNLILLDCHLLEDIVTSCLSESATFRGIDNLLHRIDNFLDNLQASNKDIKKIKENIKNLKGSFCIFWGIWGIFLNEIKQREKNFQFYVRILDFAKSGNRWMKVEQETKKIIYFLDEFKNNLCNLNDKLVSFSSDLTLFNWIEKSNSKQNISSTILGFVKKIDKLRENLHTMILNSQKQEIYWGIAEEDNLGIFKAPFKINSFGNHFFQLKKCIVLASPSLETKGNFDFIKDTLGVFGDFTSSKIRVSIEKPFIYIFRHSPQSSNLGFWKSINQTLSNFLLNTSSNVLVYFTSLSNIRESFKEVALQIEKEKISILAQGVNSSTANILETFKEYSSQKRIILFCTDNILELLPSKTKLKFNYLVITKLPFDSLSNPISAARMEKISSGFSNYIIPRAIIRFKKILHHFEKLREDQKKIFILDDRITKEDYGKDFLKSLVDYKIKNITKDQISKLK